VKIRTWTVSLAVLVAGAANAKADTSASGWSYDNNVKDVAFASDCCEPECGAAECCDPCCDDGCCGDACCGDGCDCGCGAGAGGGCCLEAFSLAALIGLADDSAYQIGGWTNVGYHDDPIPLSFTRNDLGSFQDYPDRFELAQQWFYLGRTVDGSNGFDIGGRIDMMYGVDAQKTQAFGNPTSLGVPAALAAAGAAGTRGIGTFDNSLDHTPYGWAIPQAYGEVAVGDLAVKVGHFFTPIGYEVVPATGNFFMSHSYTMFNSEPFTHTGALATYSGFEALTLYGGWTAGWDTGFDQFASGSNAIGGFGINVGDNITLTYLNTYGNFGWRDLGGDDSYSHSFVGTVGLTDNLQYIFQSDYLRTDEDNDAILAVAGLPDETIGINQYMIYSLNDLISLGGRIEWWRADVPGALGHTSFYGATGGVNFHVLDNLVFRPEYRQDWCPATDLDVETAAVDMILSY
jgi:hypothetical protein